MRRGKARTQGPALAAARFGRPRYLNTPEDVKRQLAKKRRRKKLRYALGIR